MNFLFLMDPLETVIMEKDTSFIFMLESHSRGHQVYYLPDGGISRRQDQFFFHVTRVVPHRNHDCPFIIKNQVTLNENDANMVFIRKDPPFDTQYLFDTWMLDLMPEHIAMMNNPTGIRTVNEKVWATQFPYMIPPTFVGRYKEEMISFIAEFHEVVAKPTDGFGGQSIFRIQQYDSNMNVILETLTQNGTRDIILQQYLPESADGDKRIILLDGNPLGAVLRVHREGEHRNNFFSGGTAVSAEITKRDKEIIAVLKPKLQELGLHFVGIDIIGDHLVEVNVTSPTCVQEINRLNKTHIEKNVIDFVEKLAESRVIKNDI